MKSLLRFEELGMFGLSIYLFALTDLTWWWFPVLLLVPDIGMIGYLINPKLGALTYNLTHHKGIAILVLCLGWNTNHQWLELAGIILFGHASFDRILGYGLKFDESFHHTHLGWIGNEEQAQ